MILHVDLQSYVFYRYLVAVPKFFGTRVFHEKKPNRHNYHERLYDEKTNQKKTIRPFF